MLYSLLLLGLLPALFLPDFLSSHDEDDDLPKQQDIDVSDGGILNQLGDLTGAEPADDEAAQTSVEETIVVSDEDSGSEILEPLLESDFAAGPDVEPVIDDALQPLIEDDLATAPSNVDPDAVLAPLIEIDAATAGTDPDPADVLAPVIEDDLAASDPLVAAAGPATLEASDPEAEIVLTGDTEAIAEIHGFDALQDVLEITMDADPADEPLDVEVMPSEDGTDDLVKVYGTLVAEVKGARGLSNANIRVNAHAARF